MADYILGDSVYFIWRTVVPTTGVPATFDDTPAVVSYEDDSLTQITAGITLSANYDSVTGLNHVTVVATTANGYELGKTYSVVVSAGNAGTGGVSEVGRVVGRFSIEAESGIVGSKVAATEVIPELTHFCDGVTSRSIISVNANFSGALALEPDIGSATIATVNSAALTGAASVTGTALTTDKSQRQALYTVAALSTTGTYTATVSVTTTDSQTLLSTGTIVVT